MKLADRDRKIAKSFKDNPSYTFVARSTGVDRGTVERVILKMRAAGYELPELRSVNASGWITRRAKSERRN